MHNVNLRLTWSKTQDYFDIQIENVDFATWFVEQCDQFGNSFECGDDFSSIQDLVNDIKNNVEQVNCFFQSINFPMQIPAVDHLVNRDGLNAMHKNWIHILRHEPRIDRIMYKKSKDLFEKFHKINIFVHEIEKKIEFRCQDPTRWRVENKFKHIRPSYGMYNVFLHYVDWGKSSFDKFINGDFDPNDAELSNWNNIGADIGISLAQPHHLYFSQDYLEYCASNQIETATRTWPLGNITDYSNNRHKVETLLYKNLQIPNNGFKFALLT